MVPDDANGPLAKLHADFNGAVRHLLGTLTEIVEGCSTIRIGTGAIAQASEGLSRRTERTADSFAATSQTLDQESEARRAGQEWVSSCYVRWCLYHLKNK